MISALAFCPSETVIEAVSDIMPENAICITDYFEDNYIGRQHRRSRRDPLFKIDMWNMYTRVKNGIPKTNNGIEGWHKSFRGSVGCSHPNLWVFLKCVQKEQAYQEFRLTQASAGHAPPNKKRKYKDAFARLINVVDKYDKYSSIIDYIKAIAYNLSF